FLRLIDGVSAGRRRYMLTSSLEFFAEANPTAARCEELARLDPTNPFATNTYLRSERSFRPQTWLLGCMAGGRLNYGCLGFVRSGRLNRSLMIPSLPAAEESFWNGLEGFGRAQKISVLELNSFGSPSASIPMLGEEVERIERHEFVLRLDDRRTGLLERMQINHRQRARKGMKAGLRVRITTDPVHLNEHVRLIAFSMQRREAKGENVPFGASSEGLRPYLESGFCRIFQAILGEET